MIIDQSLLNLLAVYLYAGDEQQTGNRNDILRDIEIFSRLQAAGLQGSLCPVSAGLKALSEGLRSDFKSLSMCYTQLTPERSQLKLSQVRI